MPAARSKTAVGFKVLSRVDLTLPLGDIDYDPRRYKYEYDVDVYGYPRTARVPHTPETPQGAVRDRGEECVDWKIEPHEVRITKSGRNLVLSFGFTDSYDKSWEEHLVLRLDRAVKALDSALALEIGKSTPKLRNFPHITRARANVYVIEAPCGDFFAVRKAALSNFSAALKKAEKVLA